MEEALINLFGILSILIFFMCAVIKIILFVALVVIIKEFLKYFKDEKGENKYE